MFGGKTETALPPSTAANPEPSASAQTEQEARKKKSFFGKIADAFKGDGGKSDKNTTPPSKTSGNGPPPP
jgi:hypothetical protein